MIKGGGDKKAVALARRGTTSLEKKLKSGFARDIRNLIRAIGRMM